MKLLQPFVPRADGAVFLQRDLLYQSAHPDILVFRQHSAGRTTVASPEPTSIVVAKSTSNSR